MTTKNEAPGGGPGAGMRRGAGALPLIIYSTPSPQKSQIPPAHLVGDEVRLWLRAEELRGNGDRQAFWDARREFLLTQASRY